MLGSLSLDLPGGNEISTQRSGGSSKYPPLLDNSDRSAAAVQARLEARLESFSSGPAASHTQTELLKVLSRELQSAILLPQRYVDAEDCIEFAIITSIVFGEHSAGCADGIVLEPLLQDNELWIFVSTST